MFTCSSACWILKGVEGLEQKMDTAILSATPLYPTTFCGYLTLCLVAFMYKIMYPAGV